jgi:adenosine deaminase
MKMRFAKTRRAVEICSAIILAFCFATIAGAQSASSAVAKDPSSQEKRAALNLQTARKNPLALRHFLLGMPKGGDLHNHLAGAVYAESWIRAAAEEHLCTDLRDHSFSQPASGDAAHPACKDGKVPADEALKNQELYDALVDAFSMRGFVPSTGVTGHDHFFSTFGKFYGAYSKHLGEWVDEVAARAAAQNEQYLELMHTPSYERTTAIAREVGWHDDLSLMRAQLLKPGFKKDISDARFELDQAGAVRNKHEHCGQPDATAACQVEVRYLCQVLRGFPKEIVFAQTLSCFELASVDSRYVGINFVMPEDAYTPMTDYDVQMRIVGFLHSIYPNIHISLHAGELAPGLVPYEGLCCHIRQAVEEAHAERIGHGVDVMYEDRPHELLREMVAKHVMVEINLTSDDVILGVTGNEHPLSIYRQFHVPVALATDDEGVSRIDLTREYVRAVQTYDLTYADLKLMVRTSMEHAFLTGAGLWANPDDFTQPASACAHDSAGTEHPSSHCGDFLQSNERARAQWELERRFTVFESSL